MSAHVNSLLMVWLCLSVSPSWAGTYDWIPNPIACTSQNAASGSQQTMPVWPEGFSLKIEANMKMGKWSYEAMEDYDGSSKMASVTTTLAGNKHQTIFNSDPEERYAITNEETCTASPGGRDFHPLPFASMTQTSLDSAKISFRHLMEFGVQNKTGFSYVGQATARGIMVNHWTSCQEWTDMSAKVQIDFYFSTQEHTSAWSQGEVPIRAEVKGTTGLFHTADIPKSSEFENVYDFTSFQASPTYTPDESLFYIPLRVVCVGVANNKAMPELPESFEMDVELSSPHTGSSVPLLTGIRYDWKHQVMETIREFARPMGVTWDKARHKPASHFEDPENNMQTQTEWITVTKLSAVNDYYTGIQYITEKNNQTCVTRAIPTSNPMTKGSMLLRLYKYQKHGLSQLKYQGRSIIRGSPVESWGMDVDGMVQKVFFLARSKGPQGVTYDKSNMTDDELNTAQIGINKLQLNYLNKYPVIMGIVVRNRTSVDNRDFPELINDLISEGVFTWYGEKLKPTIDKDPTKLITDDRVYKEHSWVRMQEMLGEHLGETDVFVQHFQPLHLETDLFRVSQCYEPEQISKVILTVKDSYEHNVLHNANYFLNPLRDRIARAVGVSIIQISDLQATPLVNREKGYDYILVTFNLLGATPMKETKNEQQDLATSKQRLLAAVKKGMGFTSLYTHDSKSFAVDQDLIVFDQDLEDFSLVKDARNSLYKGDDDDDDDDDDGKYSGGFVAGVAIAVAIVTCTATTVVIYLFFKSRRPIHSPSIPYVMDKE